MPREFEIRKEVDLDASPDAVWHAITTPEGLAAWFMPMPMDPDGDMVVAWEPGKRLRIEMPAGPGGASQAFEYLIEARGGGSAVLRFVHSGFIGDDDWSDEFEPMTSAGWDQYLFTLAQYFRYFAGRAAKYVEAEAPPAAATPEAWERLLAALGGVPQIGATAGIDLASGPITGSIDYLTENFVGIRTDDALVRFHGRWPIGMTLAVSHHTYTAIDTDALTAAWTAWLARVFA
jgi:hypothetical protein